MKWVLSAVLVVTFVLTILSMIPSAEGLDGDINTLENGTYSTFDRKFKDGDQLTFAFETGNDIPIDVFSVDNLNYELYKDGENFLYFTGTFLNATEGNATIDFTYTDHYYIVFDNTYVGEAQPPNGSIVIETEISYYIAGSNAPPPGAEVEVTSGNDPYFYYPGYILVIILVLMVILIAYLFRSGDDYLDYQ